MIFLLLACSHPAPVVEPYGSRPYPSFDCDRATTPVEQAICADEDLADLDQALHYTYYDLKEVRGDAASDEARWLRERNACRSAIDIKECVADAYLDRLLEIGSVVNPLVGFFTRGALGVESDEFKGLSVAEILPDTNRNLSVSGWSVASNSGRSTCDMELQGQVVAGETVAAYSDEDSVCIARLTRTASGVHIDTSDGCRIFCGGAATWGGDYRRLTDPVERRRWERE